MAIGPRWVRRRLGRCLRRGRPRPGDHARRVMNLLGGGNQGCPQLLEFPSLPRARTQRLVDGSTELSRQVAAMAAQGWEVSAQTPGSLGRGTGPERVHARERLV